MHDECTPSSVPAVIYAAKSTTDRHQSIPTQLQDARASAEAAGRTVVASFSDEAASAYTGNRGQGLTAAKDAAIGAATAQGSAELWVQHSDRLARGDGITADHLAEVWFALRRHGVGLRSADDDHNLEDALRVVLIGERNHEDSKRKAENVAKGMRRRRAKGMHNGGPEKFGYRYVRDAYGRTLPDAPLEIHPIEADVVRRIYADLEAGVTQKQLARDLTNEGVRSKRGSQWYQGTIAKIASDPFYAGLIRQADGTLTPGRDPAIVDRARQERLGPLMAARGKRGPGRGGRRPSRPVLFTHGHLRCGSCGGPMRYAHRRQGDYLWERYICSRRERDKDRCPQRPLPVDVVEGAVLYALRERAGQVKQRAEDALEALERDRRVTGARRAEAERERAIVLGRLGRIEADYLDGRLSAEHFHRFTERLAAERAAADAQVARLATREAELVAHVSAAEVQDAYVAGMAQLRDSIADALAGAHGIDRVRDVLRRIFPTITVRRVGDDFYLDPGDVSEDFAAELAAPNPYPATAHNGLPSASLGKSWVKTAVGLPLGRNSRPPFLNSPISSFFLVSTEIAGSPVSSAVATRPLMWRNWASRSGCCLPSLVFAAARRL